jgi:hypothetical protein
MLKMPVYNLDGQRLKGVGVKPGCLRQIVIMFMLISKA